MKNINVNVTITATSNKQDSKFKVENPKKSLYITPQNDMEKQKLISLGLNEYTSKDGVSFFIVKSTDQIKCWLNGEVVQVIDASVNDDNFKFKDGYFATVNIVEGENMNNKFYRLNAIKLDNDTVLDDIYQPVTESCPF